MSERGDLLLLSPGEEKMGTYADRMENQSSAKLWRLIERVQDVDPKMEVQHLRVLLYIAENPDTPILDIGDHVGLQPSAVSRNVAYWSKVRKAKKPGKDMLIHSVDDFDRRKTLVRLNSRGERFLQDLLREID